MKLQIHNWLDLTDAERHALLQRPALEEDRSVQAQVAEIIAAVQGGGDDALRELTTKLDGVTLESFRVDPAEIDAATRSIGPKAVAAIDLAIANVRRFHEPQLPSSVTVETMPGVRCERRSHPLDAVGLYVPAGTAPLPSAAVMLAVPATLARCPVRVMCTPPRRDGRADPGVVVAASRAGVTDIFKLGGAQAIAAMAYGTATVPKVNKVFGPGNAWVTRAKIQVSSDPRGASMDMPAGPSEVLVIADYTASTEFVASDLLAQAEHGRDSQVLLVTDSLDLAMKVQAEIELQLETLSRAEIARAALAQSRAIIVDSIDAAIAVSNRYAPEHLILQTVAGRDLLPSIRNAGSVFIGRWTPESVGDYCSGTNHVLPTYGFASSHSGLGVDQFMRHMTIQELTRGGLEELGEAVICLAGLEGLDAHAASVSRRLRAVS